MDTEVKTAYVDELPPCDFCKMEGKEPPEPAEYDAATASGPWASMCEAHYQRHGIKPLGLGRGQKLVVRGSVKHSAEVLSKADALCKRCGQGCPEDSFNKETGRHRILGDDMKIEVMISMGMYCEEI